MQTGRPTADELLIVAIQPPVTKTKSQTRLNDFMLWAYPARHTLGFPLQTTPSHRGPDPKSVTACCSKSNPLAFGGKIDENRWRVAEIRLFVSWSRRDWKLRGPPGFKYLDRGRA